ncbi:two-component system sensor histidine kinase YesM [Planomicrobium sp. HSC-17F08]|nr:two-component system sensor histidine kinase YesM [Planomicrobium sp. HSC-17F08]
MIKKFLDINLRAKLIIVILLASLIPILLLGFFSYHYITGLLQEETSKNEQQKLTSANNQLMNFLQDVEQMSLFFSKNDAVKDILASPSKDPVEKHKDYQAINELFNTVLSVKKWEVDVYLIGLNGDRYFSSEYLPPTYNQIRENWGVFRQASEANGSLVWDTNYSINKLEDQEVVMTAGRQIVDPSTNKKLGYIMIDVKSASFSTIYKQNNDADTEQFFLLDKEGYTIFSNLDKEKIGTQLDIPFLDKVLNGDSGFSNLKWEETPSIFSYHTSDDAGFKLISIIPLGTVLQKNNLIFNLTWNFALVGIILSAWVAYYLSTTVTRPLYKLIYLMNEVEKGNLDIRFNSRYNDDIGVFGNRFNRMLSRLKALLQDSYEKQVRMKEAELKALRAQINPHFLYNTLETVNWLARLNGSQDISKIVVSLGEIMRYSIKKGDNFVTVEEDIKQLKNYLKIQEFRYRNKFDSELIIDETLDKELIPSLIIQPLVENAMIHGLESKLEKGQITVILAAKPEGIAITIEDDGTGMDAETLRLVNRDVNENLSLNPTSIGIENVRKRLYLSYGNQFKWSLHSALDQGTRIEILVPYQDKEGYSHA